MLADSLKEETLAYHQQLEKKLVGKIKAIETEADYVKLLMLFYAYFGGLEDRITQFIRTAEIADYAQRRKTQAIANDIKSFDANPAAKATGDGLPQINNAAQAFGALYVIEGSTLGGSIISKMVSGKLGINKGLSFFNGYGDKSHQMWGIFKNTLNAVPQTDAGVVIDAANNTFLKFKDWIELYD